jgi:hypothetical protein
VLGKQGLRTDFYTVFRGAQQGEWTCLADLGIAGVDCVLGCVVGSSLGPPCAMHKLRAVEAIAATIACILEACI